MSVSMYDASVPVFRQMLGALDSILDKAAAHAEAKKIDPTVFTNARLSPDMLPFTRQIFIATDFAKGATARLVGAEPPKYEDTETTFAELKARIKKTLDYIATLKPAQFENAATRDVVIPLR